MKESMKLRFAKWGGAAALALMPFVNAQAVTVDLLVLYDTHTHNHYNGQAGTAIQGWVNQVNSMHQNSGTDIQLRLVGALHHDEDGGDMGAVLGNLKNDTWVNERRNALGADFVTQVHRTGSCGVGYVAVHRDWAYNFTGTTCGGQVLAHELGHNMGLVHSRKQGDQGGARYRYGIGYGVDSLFASIMAYPGVFNGQWMTRFSSPNASCQGLPCGVPAGQANEADASRALAEVKNDIANFMPTKVGGGGGTTTNASPAYIIKARHSGKCLDVAGGSKSNGAEIIQWSCHKGDNQRFRVYDAGGGYWQIQAKHSGMCLDVWGASTASGAQVRQGNCHSGNNQN
ncbi:MAG: RICIN domain-containing protein [Hahellaceae bacterium]|nr:RICIN domain-containing protein [Hahellaceae bacterium]